MVMAIKGLDSLVKDWKEEEVHGFTGWNFSHLSGRFVLDIPPWSYEDMARELLATSGSALDLGTGGGEKLLEFRNAFPPRMVATEGYEPNLPIAKERLGPLGVEVVKSNDSLQAELPFEDQEFGLIIDRHTCFNISEIERVLAPMGMFLTQQTDGNNLADLSVALDCEQPWTFFTLDFVLEKIKATNLIVEKADEWTGKATFKDVGAVVYYLKAVPWTVPCGFSVDKHQSHLVKLQQKLELEGSLTFKQKLFMVRARKI